MNDENAVSFRWKGSGPCERGLMYNATICDKIIRKRSFKNPFGGRWEKVCYWRYVPFWLRWASWYLARTWWRPPRQADLKRRQGPFSNGPHSTVREYIYIYIYIWKQIKRLEDTLVIWTNEMRIKTVRTWKYHLHFTERADRENVHSDSDFDRSTCNIQRNKSRGPLMVCGTGWYWCHECGWGLLKGFPRVTNIVMWSVSEKHRGSESSWGISFRWRRRRRSKT